MQGLHFLATARPKRENFLQTLTPEEMGVMARHFEYTNRLFAEGKVAFGGACTDGALGLVLYKASSEEEALELYHNDPLFQSGITEMELHPFRVGMMDKGGEG